MLRQALILAAAIPVIAAAPLRAQSRQPCVIARVVDGDTFHCADGLKVRPIGFDTPERGQGEIYVRAREELRAIANVGDTVALERDVTLTDRYGRRLAWVWRDTVLVNEAMVAGGWGVLLTIPPNVRYVTRLEAAQRAARESGAGLWATNGFECTPAAYRRRAC